MRFRQTTSLPGLYLNVNRIGDSGACALAEMLSENQNLLELGLASNGIGPCGVALANALKTHQGLRSLELGFSRSTRALHCQGNCLGDEGAIALADALKQNRTLMHLDLSRNGMTASGLAALIAALQENQTLQSLRIDGPGQDVLADILQRNREQNPGQSWKSSDISLIKSVYRT
ncbi:MAG: hypothetical protein U0903_12240 [Planctomycetales bacterium]